MNVGSKSLGELKVNELNTMSYTDLLALNEKLATEIASRNDKEKKKASKEWLTAEGQKYIPAIEALQKKYDKLIESCSEAKSVVLRVKMEVSIDPVMDFKEIISDEWHKERYELFDIRTEGELLNRDVLDELGDRVQDNIDNVMENVCDEAVRLVPKFANQIDDFLKEVNDLKSKFEDEAWDGVTLGDVIKQFGGTSKTNKPKKVKK